MRLAESMAAHLARPRAAAKAPPKKPDLPVTAVDSDKMDVSNGSTETIPGSHLIPDVDAKVTNPAPLD